MRVGSVAMVAVWVMMGCASAGRSGAAEPSRTETVAFLRAQLAGHLERAHGCFEEAPLRDGGEAGMVRYGFTIRPDGRVEDVAVTGHAPDGEALAACVRSRLVALYFDPAPPNHPVRIERTVVRCEDDASGVCRLGPVRAVADEVDPGLLTRIDEGLAARDARLRACAAEAGGGEAVFDVRLELGPGGRVMQGRVVDSVPERTELRRCAVGPLLGASVEGEGPEAPLELRYVYRLGAAGEGPQARR